MSRSEIAPLTGLRFVAAFIVFWFHIQARWPVAGGPIGNALDQGAVGMSLFFILSGYILSYQYVGRNMGGYTLNRVARIVPIYLLAAFVTVPFLLIQMSAESWPMRKLVALVLATLTGSQAWFPSLFSYWNHSASWSISAEFFFYALFPLLLPLVWKAKSAWTPVALAYGASLIPLAIYIAFYGHAVPGLYSLPLYRLPEFCFGVAIYRVASGWDGERSGLLTLSGLIPLAALLLFNPRHGIHVTSNGLVVPALGLIIVGVSKGDSLVSRFLSWAPMQELGRASYCFYSFQALVLLSGWQFANRPVDGLRLGFVCFFALLAISLFAYRFIEKPVRRKLRAAHERRSGSQNQGAAHTA